jgi:hypothetical protein
MLSLRSLAAVLFSLGSISSGLAQDNPWRVPGYGGGAWPSYPPRNDAWNGGYQPGPAQPPNQGGGNWGGRPGADAQAYPRGGWNAGREARQPSGSDQRATLERPGYAPPPSAPDWNRPPGRYGYPDTNGGYANPGYAMPSNAEPYYHYGRQFGEFPPAERDGRTPGVDSLPPQAPTPRQPTGSSSGYGGQPNQQPAPPAYGYGYGYGAAFGGPSTLNGPLGGFAPGYGAYGIPYGIGVPGLYGW